MVNQPVDLISDSNIAQSGKPSVFDSLSKWIRKAASVRWLWPVVCLGLALIPVLRILLLIHNTGDNNLSNDYILYINIVDRILSGTYHWVDIFHDTFVRTHLGLIPALASVADAFFFRWNVYIELYFGVFLAFMRLLLTWDLLTMHISRKLRWGLLPIFSALIFSYTQTSGYVFGTVSLSLHINLLGVVLGIWGICRFPGSWKGLGVMALGGLIATWSWGAGLAAWPIFLLTMLLSGYRKFMSYLAWLTLALIICSPYIYFIFIANTDKEKVLINTLPEVLISFIKVIGQPFANLIGAGAGYLTDGEIAAFCCILLITVWAGLWLWRGKKGILWYVPGILLILFGGLASIEISIVRTMVAPWYAIPAMFIWMGLAGLAGTSVASLNAKYISPSWDWIWPAWGAIVILIISVFYIRSNTTYADKSFYLPSRAPVSAACLRNYRTAPTYCEGTIFQWGLGHYNLVNLLAEPLERHQLSVFAPHQKWTLQGDFILDTVQVKEAPAGRGVFWSTDLSSNPISFRDYRHLNLAIPTQDSVSWTINLPLHAQQIDFQSAVAISTSAPQNSGNDTATLTIFASQGDGQEQPIFTLPLPGNQHTWQPFHINLDSFAGQRLTLRFTSSGEKNSSSDWLMLRAPIIDLVKNGEQTQAATKPDIQATPLLTKGDLVFDLQSQADWDLANIKNVEGKPANWIIKNSGSLTYNKPIDACLSNYSDFYFQMSAPINPEYINNRSLQTRIVNLQYRLQGMPDFDSAHVIQMPLYPDSALHEYTYPIRLLEGDRRGILTGLRLNINLLIPGLDETITYMPEIRLISNGEKGKCPSAVMPVNLASTSFRFP